MRCWFCRHDPEQIHDPAIARKLEAIFVALETLRTDLMTAISDFAAKQAAYNDDIAADLTSIQTQLAALNATITQLQNSQGDYIHDKGSANM